MEKTVQHNTTLVKDVSFLRAKITDYSQLLKLRLSLLVVFSSVITYLTAASGAINWFEVSMLAMGGLLVTGAANGLNQVIEHNYDKLMVRTANRPVAAKRMSIFEASVVSLVMGLIGVFIIGRYLNQLSGLLAFISLMSYAFIYTPLKRVSPISVFVGAFPGALPTMLGWVAFTGNIGTGAWVLFLVQFVWQFPHFWSIGWILDDDYKRAGFKMLPFNPGRTKKTALQCIAFTVLLIPVGMLPAYYGISGNISVIVAVLGGLYFSYYAYKLYKGCENADAKKLMFASIIYLPIIQLAYLLDKI